MKRSGYMERSGPLEAKRWGVRRAPRDSNNWRRAYLPDWMTAEEAEKLTPFEKAWLRFVALQDCICAHLRGCDGDVVPAHITLSANEKGTGMKVDTRQTVPMCVRHHDFWDGRLGRAGNPFAGMKREERYERGAKWVADVQQGAKPGDSRDEALALQDLGLGWIELVGNGWTWHEGTRPDDAPKVTRNSPTPEGRAAGLVIAQLCDEAEAKLRARVGPTPPRCGGCAGRAGTEANGAGATIVAFTECLVTGEPFFCHAGLDLENDLNPQPTHLCRAWLAMARPQDVARVEAAIVAGSLRMEEP